MVLYITTMDKILKLVKYLKKIFFLYLTYLQVS